MTLKLVPTKDVAGSNMQGKRKLYRDKEKIKKEAVEKRRLTILKTIDTFDDIEKQNIVREGKYKIIGEIEYEEK